MGMPYAEVIGDPVGHSKSPLIQKFWLEELGLDYDFRRAKISKRDLPDFLEQRRGDPDWRGCNVTIPNKIAVIDLLDDLSAAARAAGAVNCVTRAMRAGAREPRLVGHNTDVAGFIAPLRPRLEKVHKMRLAYVLGTGGAAAAVSVALSREGFVIVSIGRDLAKAVALRHRLHLFDDHLIGDLASCALPGQRDWGDRTDMLILVVNATPLGMTGYPRLAFDLDFLPRDAIVYDLVYAPLETPLLRAARAGGLATVGGLDMLVAQAAEAFELFFTAPAPRQRDDALFALLTR
jgi:shikimate dehydrogenase